MADTDGINALSMRSLSKALGAGVMSLYNHVSDKQDLLDGMAESITAEFALPAPGTPWKAGLRELALSALAAMRAHPWLVPLWSGYLGYAKNRYHDAILRTMHEAEFPEELACRGFHALTMHVVGFSHQTQEMPFSNRAEMLAFANAHIADLEAQNLPYLRAHVQFHLDGKDRRSDFQYMLDLILDGLERDLTAT